MTTIETHAQATTASQRDAVPQLLVGIADWVSSSDHKKIGRLFVALSWLLALGTAVVAALIGIERITPSTALIDADAAPQLLAIFRFGLGERELRGCALAQPLQQGLPGDRIDRIRTLGRYVERRCREAYDALVSHGVPVFSAPHRTRMNTTSTARRQLRRTATGGGPVRCSCA